MVTVPPPESLLPSRCGDMALWYALLLCTWTWCILDEGVQQKGWVSEETQGINTWEEPGAGLGGFFSSNNDFLTADLGSWTPFLPHLWEKQEKLTLFLRTGPLPSFFVFPRRILQQLLYSSEMFLPGKQGKVYTQGHYCLMAPRCVWAYTCFKCKQMYLTFLVRTHFNFFFSKGRSQ